jgi:hypothetical protein
MSTTVDILDHDDFRKLVEDNVLSAVSQHAPSYPVQLDNIPFEQPKGGYWVSLCIKTGDSQRRSIGSDLFIERTPGFVQIDVTIPKDKGHAEVEKLAHKLADSLAYRKPSRGTITANFWKKSITSAPVTGPYYRIMGRVFFWYEGFVKNIPAGV